MRIVEDVTTRRPWTKFHTAFVLILLAIQLPEVAAFYPEGSVEAFKVYDTMNQVAFAVLCLALGLCVNRGLFPFAAFYVGQAVDEWFYNNEWLDGVAEYAVLFVLTLLAWKLREK